MKTLFIFLSLFKNFDSFKPRATSKELQKSSFLFKAVVFASSRAHFGLRLFYETLLSVITIVNLSKRFGQWIYWQVVPHPHLLNGR